MPEPASNLFRQEVIDQHKAGQQAQGDVLRISPSWTVWTYWLLLGVVVVGAIYVTLGSVNQYASGPALVRCDGRTVVTATSAGTVASIHVEPGRRVASGQLLVRLDNAQELAELDRINQTTELHLKVILREPSNQAAQAARQALSTLHAQEKFAESRLAERIVRAPQAGVVSDVRVRLGQHLAPGEIILTIVDDESTFSVIVMLPGQYRPMLKAGGPLRLELAGYRYAYQDLVIDSIADEVVGPREARRLLDQGVADAVLLPGSVVLVHARLPASQFTAAGRWYDYYDGMQGIAEARIRSESILCTLVPAIKALFNDTGQS